ncbi:MAG: hypothetical protein ACLQHS_17950 [Candidatus Limnocylindrales bacterium]|jgi:hypothetical protein
MDTPYLSTIDVRFSLRATAWYWGEAWPNAATTGATVDGDPVAADAGATDAGATVGGAIDAATELAVAGGVDPDWSTICANTNART